MTELSPTSPTRQPRASLSNHVRNTLRLNSRLLPGFTSPKASNVRAPILLELYLNQGIITVGWVGQPRHQVLRFVSVPNRNVISSAPDYYRVYASTILEALEWLGSEAAHRRVVVCHDYGYDLPTAFQEAVERALLCTAGVEAVSFHSTWWTIPAAVPAIQDALVVAATMTGIHCYAYAAGDVLPFTFQSCTASQQFSAQTPVAEWQHQLDEWLTSRENNLIAALLACLQACPRAARRAVIHNIWLIGSVILDVPGYSKEIVKALKKKLEGNDAAIGDSEPSDGDAAPLSTQLPIAMKELQPLASHVSSLVVDSSDLAWLGASRWAYRLHGVDPDAKFFQWKFAKSSNSAKNE